MVKRVGFLPGSPPAAVLPLGLTIAWIRTAEPSDSPFDSSLPERIFPNVYLESDLIRPTESVKS